MTSGRPIGENSGTRKATIAKRSNRVKATYHQLREIIVHGRLAPGTRIIEADLANRLGVSRTPVRDALRMLHQEGYVLSDSAGGYKSRWAVAPLTKEDARELYRIIGRVEGLAAGQAAQLEPGARLKLAKRLESLTDGLRDIAQTGRADHDRIFELDLSFHRSIVEAGAGPRLLRLHDAIKPQTERYWRLYASAIVDQLGASVAEHAQISQAIEHGDGDAAERGVQINWRNGAERLSKVIDSLGERGSW
jgi:DNA-binding GntR family transcriptional regulator